MIEKQKIDFQEITEVVNALHPYARNVDADFREGYGTVIAKGVSQEVAQTIYGVAKIFYESPEETRRCVKMQGEEGKYNLKMTVRPGLASHLGELLPQALPIKKH